MEINTTLTLCWRIKYDCSDGNKCIQLMLNTSNNHGLYDFPNQENHEILNDVLFDAATTIRDGPNINSYYADVRIIMFIDEYVRNNVSFVHCKVTVSGDESSKNENMVNIIVSDPLVPTTAIPNSLLPLTSTSKPPTCMKKLICNSAHVVCSSRLHLGLLCFIQMLYVVASYSS